MDWDDLRYILAISRAGTLAGAARRLAVDETTAARRLAAAERALGERLFDRVERRLRPTPAGRAALGLAATIEAEVQGLRRCGAVPGRVTGLVRLSAVPLLVNRLLVPALPALRAAHPDLTLELIAEPRNLSLARREADVALRLARPERGASLLARRIGRLDYAVYGPRGRRAGQLPWVGYAEGSRHLPPARWIAAAAGSSGPAVVANDAEVILQAVRAGLGRSLLPCRLADGDPGLRRLDPAVALSREIWLLCHRDTRHEARIEVTLAWLAALFAPAAARSRQAGPRQASARSRSLS